MPTGMRPKVKSAHVKAGKLHGATAQFVSIVDRGANETPFTLIKTAKGASAMGIKQRGNTKKSHKTVQTGKKSSAEAPKMITEMASMSFDLDIFTTKKSVLAKIEEMEWDAENIVVTKNADDGVWEARVKGVSDEDYERLEKVETDEDGVEASVGSREAGDDEDIEDAQNILLSEDDDDDDDDADDDDDDDDDDTVEKGYKKPVKKTAVKPVPAVVLSKRAAFVNARKGVEKIAKFDSWDAHFSKGNTLAKTLTDGMIYDGLPPGYYEVQAAFGAATSNIVSDDGLGAGKQEALNKAAMDFAEIIGGLDTFFDGFVDADEASVKKVFPDEEARDILVKWAGEYGDVLAGKAVETISKSDGAAIDYNQIGETVANLIAKAMEPLATEVKSVSDNVTALSSRRPSKKALDPDGLGDGDNLKKDEDGNDTSTWARAKQTKSILG
jgi:hypothetical protein